jgi:hypothetical protein
MRRLKRSLQGCVCPPAFTLGPRLEELFSAIRTNHARAGVTTAESR